MKTDPTKTLAENVVACLTKLRRGRSMGLKDWEKSLLVQAEKEVDNAPA
jgi:hypothetical protein